MTQLPSEAVMRLADHIEMVHERELAPGTPPTVAHLSKMHRDMHAMGAEPHDHSELR